MQKGKPAPVPVKTAKTGGATVKHIKESKSAEFAFTRINYILMLTGIGVMIIGYLLMVGGKADDPSVFNPDVFSARRISVAPVVVIIGIIIEIYAIIKKVD